LERGPYGPQFGSGGVKPLIPGVKPLIGARAPSPARFQNTFKLVKSVSFGQDRLTLHNAAETAAVRCILPKMSPQTLSRKVRSPEHICTGANHLQNYDGSNYGAVWHWAGAQNSHGSPLRSPNPDTASHRVHPKYFDPICECHEEVAECEFQNSLHWHLLVQV
jgi:hypothetical protein